MTNLNVIILLFILIIAESYHAVRFKRQLLVSAEVRSAALRGSSHNVNNSTHAKNATSVPSTMSPSTASSHQSAADVAVAVIIIIVISVILGMAIYFIRKFDQLNKMVPTYRYSSLKTEINGVNGYDDKIESQALVNASTEEEDFDEEEQSSPPTLIVHSQTTYNSSKLDSMKSVPSHNGVLSVSTTSAAEIKQLIATDSDDELLQ